MPETPAADPERAALDLLLRGFQVSRMLRLVADLGIADRVPVEGRIAVGDLAIACDVESQPLARVLRALAACGVFAMTPDGAVTHTPRSRLLRTDVPMSLHHAARFWTAPGAWHAWSMLDAALTGGIPHEAAWGMGRFDYLRAHPDEARAFDAMMANFPDGRHAAIAAAYDFSAARLIVDIGGGNGATLREVLARAPSAHGRVFDREDVVRAVPPGLSLDGRISFAGGSFFDGVPAGGDIYLIVRVLHDWPDADCLRILRACRAVMTPEARLLLGEHILEPSPDRGQPADYLVDTQMMVMFGSARSRTEDEFRALLSEAGLALRRVIATESPVSILEAALA